LAEDAHYANLVPVIHN